MDGKRFAAWFRRVHRTKRGVTVLILTGVTVLSSLSEPANVALLPVQVPLVWATWWGLVLVVPQMVALWAQRRPRSASGIVPNRGGQPGLRLDTKAAFIQDRRGFFFRRRIFFHGTAAPLRRVPITDFTAWSARQCETPVPVAQSGAWVHWWYADQFYRENFGYQAADVLALARERQRRHERQLERAHMALRLEQEPASRRVPIARDVKLAVFERDGGRCVECESSFEIQYDHVIPVALGGSSTPENLQLLCAPCNQRKGRNL